MANENDSTWGLNVKIDDETANAAKKLLEEHPEEQKRSFPWKRLFISPAKI
jgi:hypothetical protein